jgi:hypothetical protein
MATKYYNGIIDSAAALYVKNFSADELRAIETFCSCPVGQKYMQRSGELPQLSQQIGEYAGRKASKDLKARVASRKRSQVPGIAIATAPTRRLGKRSSDTRADVRQAFALF